MDDDCIALSAQVAMIANQWVIIEMADIQVNISIDKGKMKGEKDQEERVMGSEGRSVCGRYTRTVSNEPRQANFENVQDIVRHEGEGEGDVQVDSIRGAMTRVVPDKNFLLLLLLRLPLIQ